VLRPDAENRGYPGIFRHRLFFLKPHDRDSERTEVYQVRAPVEAVAPRTVAPGIPGRLTSHAWGHLDPDGCVGDQDAQHQ
jgi:hypothetical protein